MFLFGLICNPERLLELFSFAAVYLSLRPYQQMEGLRWFERRHLVLVLHAFLILRILVALFMSKSIYTGILI